MNNGQDGGGWTHFLSIVLMTVKKNTFNNGGNNGHELKKNVTCKQISMPCSKTNSGYNVIIFWSDWPNEISKFYPT